MDVVLTLTSDERETCRRAAVHLRGLCQGLAAISSKDAAACERYAATLDVLTGRAGAAAVSDTQKADVEQASFLLEGIRNGLDNADLDTAAELVQVDIERLTDVVLRHNSEASKGIIPIG